MAIERCSVAWTESGSAPAFTYSYSGTTSMVVSSRAIIGAGYLRQRAADGGERQQSPVTVTLPSTAGKILQGLPAAVYVVSIRDRTCVLVSRV
jgi:spore coat-associated protein N